MLIKIPDDILACAPIYSFVSSKSGLDEVVPPDGSGTEGMPAAQDLVALLKDYQSVINAYVSLVDYDGKRMVQIVDSFISSDCSH